VAGTHAQNAQPVGHDGGAVRVPDEADRLVEGVELRFGRAEAVETRPGGGPVGTGVDEAQRVAAGLDRPRERQVRQPVELLVGKLLAVVAGSGLAVAGEHVGAFRARDDGVVVAHDDPVAPLADAFHARGGGGAVSHHVAEAVDGLGPAALVEGLEDGLQGFEVGMNVGDDGDAQRFRVWGLEFGGDKVRTPNIKPRTRHAICFQLSDWRTSTSAGSVSGGSSASEMRSMRGPCEPFTRTTSPRRGS
jgi:hypothetical protein